MSTTTLARIAYYGQQFYPNEEEDDKIIGKHLRPNDLTVQPEVKKVHVPPYEVALHIFSFLSDQRDSDRRDIVKLRDVCRILSSCPRTLPNCEAFSLIESLAPGQVLLNIMTKAGLNVSSEFEDFSSRLLPSG